MPACPLTVSWVCGQPSSSSSDTHTTEEAGKWGGGGGGATMGEGAGDGGGVGGNMDFESIVLTKLRQAEERKRQSERAGQDGDS